MISSRLEAAIVTALIRWPRRTKLGVTTFEAIKAAIKAAQLDFGSHFKEVYPALRTRIAANEINAAFAAIPDDSDYRSWWTRLLDSSGIEIDFVDGEPRIAIDSLSAWEGSLDHFDADALITRRLVDMRGPATAEADLRDLDRWGTVARSGDRELEKLWARDLSDMHVHIGGARFVQAVWFDLMDQMLPLDRFGQLNRIVGMPECIADARDARKTLWEKLGGPIPEEEAPLTDTGEAWRWNPRRLIGERVLLTRCWAITMEEPLCSVLDIYLSAKSQFIGVARQPIETGPGLEHFLPYQNSLKVKLSRSPTSKALRDVEHSSRLANMSTGDALAFLGESQHLKRVELRYAPPKVPNEMGRHAIAFGQLLKAFNKARPKGCCQLDARLAFHFKRSRDKGSRDLGAVLMLMDQQSAALRLALSEKASGKALRKWLARIDVAGQERDTSLIECIPYVRLAVGDRGALRDLDRLDDQDPRVLAGEFDRWRAVVDQGRNLPSLTERRLGVTVHAGEDFADPLSGLHEVASAVDLLRLRPGDGIGHGLALKSDMARFATLRNEYAMITHGAHIDSLAWLIEMMESEGYKVGSEIYQRLRLSLEESARELYEVAVPASDLSWLRRARACPATPDRNELYGVRSRLWNGQVSDRQKRDKLIPIPAVRIEPSTDILRWAQTQVLMAIKRQRVVVELNPSSNLRISAATGIDLSATVDLFLEVERGLLASVNTDNPGTCLSRIENEYALLLAACRKRDIDEWRCRNLLEIVRRTGMEMTYWPER